jgi:hypothetical protein
MPVCLSLPHIYLFILNVLQNHNASSPMSNETLLKYYSEAVGSALAAAFGLATLIQK